MSGDVHPVFDRLGDFVTALDRAGELVRVKAPVAAKLELSAISDRVMKQPGGGKALLFEHVLLDDGTRSPCPVAINLFGSMRRMAMALGAGNLDDIGGRITELLELKVPDGLLGKLALVPRLLEVAKFPPRTRGPGAASQEIIARGEDADLRRLPVLTCWPADGGPYITLPMVISRDPVRGIRNVGMYRVQVLGPRTLAMHWQRHKVGAAHWRTMAERGETMPVCIAIGARPGVDLRGERAAAADGRRVSLRRIPAALAGVAGPRGDMRPRSAGRGRVRDRGLHRPARAAGHRGAVRRPHRILLARPICTPPST